MFFWCDFKISICIPSLSTHEWNIPQLVSMISLRFFSNKDIPIEILTFSQITYGRIQECIDKTYEDVETLKLYHKGASVIFVLNRPAFYTENILIEKSP